MAELFRKRRWKSAVKEARYSLKERKFNVTEQLPLTRDIQIFSDKLNNEVERFSKLVDSDEKALKQFTKYLMVKITMFNARRPFECGLMTVDQFHSRINGDNENIDYINQLTEKEKILAKSMSLVKVMGKHARIVPILLNEKIWV